MAYINQTQDSRRRATAVAGVVAVHATLGLALLSMGVVGSKDNVPLWKTVVITPDPIPTPTPTTETIPDQSDTVITAPVAQFDSLKPADESAVVSDQVLDDWPIVSSTFVDRPTPTPMPSLGFTPKGAIPANRPASWISTDDYPARPLRDEVEGVAEYRVIIGSNGLVSNCEITRSTGNGALDATTCRLISRRARFEAATDQTGASVVGSYTGKVRWEIPD